MTSIFARSKISKNMNPSFFQDWKSSKNRFLRKMTNHNKLLLETWKIYACIVWRVFFHSVLTEIWKQCHKRKRSWNLASQSSGLLKNTALVRAPLRASTLFKRFETAWIKPCNQKNVPLSFWNVSCFFFFKIEASRFRIYLTSFSTMTATIQIQTKTKTNFLTVIPRIWWVFFLSLRALHRLFTFTSTSLSWYPHIQIWSSKYISRFTNPARGRGGCTALNLFGTFFNLLYKTFPSLQRVSGSYKNSYRKRRVYTFR